MNHFLGPRVVGLASALAGTWFIIILVLLSRPPGVPEFVSEDAGPDEQHVIRKDVIPKLPMLARIRLALGVACAACLVVWLSLGLLR